MQQALAIVPEGTGPVTALLVHQVDFGAAPTHPEQARFADAQRASPIFRPSPMLFRAVDLDRQTSEERHQEIHRQTKCLAGALSVERPAKYELRRTIVFSSHSSEPMVDQRRFSDSAQATIVTTLTFLFAHARSRKAISSS